MKSIYLSQRVDEAAAYRERRDALDQRWAALLFTLGLLPLPLPNHPEAVEALLQKAPPDGLLLTGGNDPAAVGGDAPERDRVDALLLRHAEAHRVPLLGVCRGMQSLLLYYGGTLVPVSGHVAVRHPLEGRWERAVNSYHKWGATKAPAPLETLATAGGVVEAVRHPSLPMVGVMWHPEREQPFGEADLGLLRGLFIEGGIQI